MLSSQVKSQWTTIFYCYPYLFYFPIYFFLVTCFRGLHAARRFFVAEEKVHRFTSSLSSPPITPSYVAAPILLHRNMFQILPRHEYSLHGRAVPTVHHPSIFIHYFSSYTFFPLLLISLDSNPFLLLCLPIYGNDHGARKACRDSALSSRVESGAIQSESQ